MLARKSNSYRRGMAGLGMIAFRRLRGDDVMRRAIAVLAGLLLSGSAIAQTTPNWALHYVPPPAEWNGLWASKQDYNAPGVFTTLATTGNATITGNLTVTGTINGAGGSFLPLKGGALTTGGSTLILTPGATTSIAPFISTNSSAGLQLNGGGTGVSIVGGGPLVSNNGVNMSKGFVPASAALTPFSTWSASLSGSTTTNNPTIWSWKVTSDQMNVPNGVMNYIDFEGAFGGPLMIGHRAALQIKMTQTAQSGNFASGLVGGGAWGVVAFAFQMNQTEGGTDTTQSGSYGNMIVGGTIARTLATATNLHEVSGWEADMNTAAPSYKKFGWKVTQLGTDVAQGVLSGAYVIENGGNSSLNGWHNGFLAIQPNGNFPYAADGWLVNAPLASDFQTFNTMAGGLNLEPTFTTAAIQSRNFTVDGLGTVRVGNGYLAKTAGGVSLDASGSVGPAEGSTLSGGAIVSGGTGYISSFVLHDPYGGLWVVTSASSGVITLLTCVRTPYFPSATPPANPITLTPTVSVSGTVGGTVTVNLTWTQPNVVALGGVGTVTAPSAAVDNSSTLVATTAFVLGQAASATPLIDGTATVGTSTRYARADHVHPTDTTRAALTGATFTGGVNVGNSSTAQVLQMNGAAATNRTIQWSTAGARRWTLVVNSTAEGGANAGSDWALSSFDDSGTALLAPLTITRSTGLFNFATAFKFTGSQIVANGAIATTVTSLGPTGSHTTIQEWLTIQNSAGTTRYIPLY